MDPATQMGPAVTDTQLAGNLKYVDIAIKEGGRLLAGGAEALKLDTPGHYMSPTLIVDTKIGDTINQEEVFGPVVSVVKIKDYEEGLAYSNGGNFGLSAGIVTTSLKHARHYPAQCEGGHGDDQPADRGRGLSRAVRRPARFQPMAPASRASRRWTSSPRSRRPILSRKDYAAAQCKRAARSRPFLLGDAGARLVSITNGETNMRAILLASALILTTGAAFADLAVSGNDGKQVRAGDGLPMKPTPDSVSVISYSSSDAPKVIGTLAVCGTILGPPLAITMAPDYSFALATCPQKIGADGKNVADDQVNVIGLDDPTHPKLLQTVEAGAGATAIALRGNTCW